MNNARTCAAFSTDHLYLAAFLICRDHDLIDTAIAETGRVRFLFDDSATLRSAVADFMAGATVDARQFSFTLLKLKKSLPRHRQ